MPTYNIHAAKTHLSRLVDAAAGGEEVLIARAGKPVARLVPLEDARARPPRRLGLLAGKLRIPADYDAPLPNDVLRDFEQQR
jgi:prevent-host-death family protein